MTLPGWMWGGDPAAFLTESGLKARPEPGQPDTWRVTTEEHYLHGKPNLFTVDHLDGPAAARPRFDLLTTAAASGVVSDPGGQHEAALEERVRELERSGALVDHLAVSQLQTLDAPVALLPEVVKGILEFLRKVEGPGEPGHPLFVDAGAHLVRRSPRVVHRAKLASALHQIPFDSRIAGGLDTATAARLLAGDDLVLNASQGLFDGVFLLDAYLGPMLGALTPFIWGFSAPRAFGTVIYSFGRPLNATQAQAAELLQLLPTQSAVRSTPMHSTPTKAAAAALDWWATRLDTLFGVITNPAVFTDRQGRYLPAKHLHALASVEQLFRRVSSIQTNHRDTNARRVLLFTVLDTLERLTGRPIDEVCSLRFAQTALDRVSDDMNSDAAAILLPAARRGVEALREAQTNLFQIRQTGASHVEVPASGGQAAQRLDPEQATAKYLKVLRNATHGHGSKEPKQIGLTNTLLAHHDGSLPHDVGLLGYLYLLDVLVHPDKLAKRLYAGGRER